MVVVGGIILIIGLLASRGISVLVRAVQHTIAATSSTGGIWGVLAMIVRSS